ncbi:MAG TPA: hypothetical protein VGB63_17610 [Pedobacter sp.]|jgi:uncharacterized protein (UPF0333 family)
MSEVKYIPKCLRLIEQKVNRGSSQHWTYEDFKKIQQLIFQASLINLSTHTLERLYGKLKTHENYKPQAETKNALAIFLGYEDWEGFKSHNPINSQEPPELLEESAVPMKVKSLYKRQSILKSRGGIKVAFVFIIIGIVSAVSMALLHRNPSNKGIDFRAVNALAASPHNVKFIHDLSQLEGDNFSIVFPEFGDDTIKLSKSQKVSYRPFFDPGAYTAYLLSDKKIIARTMFFIKTTGWHLEGTMTPHDKRTKWFVPQTSLVSKGKLFTPSSFVADSLKKKYGFYFLSYSNIRKFNVSGDNVLFETRFRNNAREERNSLCNDMWFKLIGLNGILNMHFLTTGCTGYIDMTFGEKNLNGSMQDLSQFGIDIHNWKKARLEVINKTVHIYIDNALIYKIAYSQSVGAIVGIEVISKTSGETDYVKLYNSKKELVYEDDFGGKVID